MQILHNTRLQGYTPQHALCTPPSHAASKHKHSTIISLKTNIFDSYQIKNNDNNVDSQPVKHANANNV